MAEGIVLKGTMCAHTDMVTAIATPIDNSDTIVTSSRDKSIILWKLNKDDKSYGVAQRRLTGHSHFVEDVALSSDGQFALSGSWDGELRLWDLATGVSTRRFVGHTKDVLSVAFSTDNRQIVSASRDGTIKLWNTLGECKYTIGSDQGGDGHKQWVSCVRFSPNTLVPTIVSASWDQTVKVWNLQNCKLRNTLAGHSGYLNTVAVSPDGSLCASGGKDGAILLWDLAEGKKLYSLEAGAIIHSLCFSPNRYWLCAATENSIRIWDLESKSVVEDLKVDLKAEAEMSDASVGTGNKTKVIYCTSLNWSADGSTLFSGYTDGVIRVCRTSLYGDDVVIVAAHRTALCKSKRGNFKDTYPDDLLAPVLRALIEKTNLDPSEVGDIVVGTVLAPGSQRASECRMSAFYAGFPETVAVRTVNRQCSSGLQAVADVAAAIKAGFYDIGIGAGLESMTTNPMAWEGSVNPAVKKFAQAQSCLLPMGVTSENVAHRFGVSRKEQDQAAVDSHRKAAAATAAGKFKDEIIPVQTKLVDPKTGDETPITVSVDDGIRPSTTLATLGKLKPVFKKDGTTTAGNSSQVSDGAGAVLLMKRSLATQKGLPVLGVFRTFAAVGVDPAIMGVGPAVAIPAAVKAAGLELDDIDLFEINEAFASQFLYCRNKLGLDEEKVNVNGGAMAIGHPLGATGARCVATLLHEMKRRGKDCRFGVVSMCIGTGMGAAAVFERGDGVDELRNARKVEAQGYLSKDAR